MAVCYLPSPSNLPSFYLSPKPSMSNPNQTTAMPNIHALIVAAGVGKRFGGSVPKQYTCIDGQTVLQHSVAALAQVAALVRCHVVIARDDVFAPTLDFALPIHWVEGGAERMDSVRHGVQAIWQAGFDSADDWVLIHDAARPCVQAADIARLIAQATQHPAGGLLAVPVRDTVKRATVQNGQTLAATTLARHELWLAQTPQLFPIGKLINYLEQAQTLGLGFTDEASLFEHFAQNTGEYPLLVEGSHSNIKLTFAEDIVFAKAWLPRV